LVTAIASVFMKFKMAINLDSQVSYNITRCNNSTSNSTYIHRNGVLQWTAHSGKGIDFWKLIFHIADSIHSIEVEKWNAN